MNVDSDKARYIECIYESAITFDLAELKVDFEQVDDYYIKYGILHIIFKDGTTTQHEGYQGETDWKWSVKEQIFNEDWNLVEGLD